MEEHRIEITRAASRELSNLEARLGRRILTSLESLAIQPRPRQSRKLTGSENSYRLQVGDYRILYEIDDTNKIITVFAVGHRRDIYR
ncbi:MAG: type II toxin-antitoxin system RelE/ParE family toxin [Dehalococcoidia bacterium]